MRRLGIHANRVPLSVDRVAHGALLVEESGGGRHARGDAGLGLLRGRADVGGGKDVVHLGVGVGPVLVRTARLLGEDVHRRGAHVSLVDGPLQVGGVVEEAAGRVDEGARAVVRTVRAELAEVAVVEQALVRLSLRVLRRDVHRDEVALPKRLRQAGAGGPAERRPHLLRDIGFVVEANVHPERVGQAGQLLANVAEPDDGERLVHQLVAAGTLLCPQVPAPRLVCGEEPTGQHDHLPHHHLHDRAAVAHRVVEHQHTLVGAGLLVDRVVADATQHDGRQVVGGLDHGLVDDELAPLVDQVVLLLPKPVHHRVLVVALGLGHPVGLDALLAQERVEAGVRLLQDEGLLEMVVEEARLCGLHGGDGITIKNEGQSEPARPSNAERTPEVRAAPVKNEPSFLRGAPT